MKKYVSKLAQTIYDFGRQRDFSFMGEIWADALEHLSTRAPRLPSEPVQVKAAFEADVERIRNARGPKARREALTHLMAVSAWWIVRSHTTGEDQLH